MAPVEPREEAKPGPVAQRPEHGPRSREQWDVTRVLRALEGCDRKGDGAACPAPWVLWVAAVPSSSPCYSL